MQINKTDNIYFLKNLESNIIDEAIVILKKNVRMAESDNKNKDENIDILKEAEIIINEKIEKSNLEFEKYKVKKLETIIKKLKIINIIIVIGSVLLLLFK